MLYNRSAQSVNWMMSILWLWDRWIKDQINKKRERVGFRVFMMGLYSFVISSYPTSGRKVTCLSCLKSQIVVVVGQFT